MDLRVRLLAAIDDGMSCRAAAVRFGVALATAIRWQTQRRDTGSFAPKPRGGDNLTIRLRCAVITVLLLTGGRYREILTLQWQDVKGKLVDQPWHIMTIGHRKWTNGS